MSIRQRMNNRGFTMVEMVVVVAVLAILVTISTPSLFSFLSMRDRNNEESTQLEIRKALSAYLADKGELPDDGSGGGSTTAWASSLAGYTNLSQDQILRDQWGRDRRYVMYADTTRNIMGTAVKVYYATLLSLGGDGVATAKDNSGNTITGLAVTTGSKPVFAAASDPTWWKNATGATTAKTDAFSKITVGGDDQLMRFTDYPQKLDAYNTTVQRLERLGQAVETFARNAYAEIVAACGSAPKDSSGNVIPPASAALIAACNNGMPEKMIYYPKATAVYSATDTATYMANGAVTTAVVVNNNQNDTNRRANMLTLVRKLGLPDDFCCSAVQYSALDKLPLPFYYFSNPRPRLSSGCGARPNSTSSAKLPARITTTNNSDNPAGGLVATCG